MDYDTCSFLHPYNLDFEHESTFTTQDSACDETQYTLEDIAISSAPIYSTGLYYPKSPYIPDYQSLENHHVSWRNQHEVYRHIGKSQSIYIDLTYPYDSVNGDVFFNNPFPNFEHDSFAIKPSRQQHGIMPIRIGSELMLDSPQGRHQSGIVSVQMDPELIFDSQQDKSQQASNTLSISRNQVKSEKPRYLFPDKCCFELTLISYQAGFPVSNKAAFLLALLPPLCIESRPQQTPLGQTPYASCSV
jgi:hypothetical protein